jgi:hypothetical protein
MKYQQHLLFRCLIFVSSNDHGKDYIFTKQAVVGKRHGRLGGVYFWWRKGRALP